MGSYADRDLYRLLVDMVRIPSVSPSADRENRMARFFRDRLAEEPYFREHPEDLRLLPLEGDPLGRHLVFGLVRAPEATGDTVLLAGHMDVVGVQACGTLAPWAFDPEEYTRRLEEAEISPEARRDLLSGEWLFGRGVMDMKGGLAAGLDLVIRAARDRSSLKANRCFLAVPDEENNSLGMLSAASYLARFQREEGLRYRACVELEPTFATGEEATPSLYLGSIGKINPFFFCLGKETHVGEYYEGFSAASLVAHVNLMLEGNPAYADSLSGVCYPPFGCMRQVDLRREYSATIMTRAFAFYSYLTVSKLPRRILEELRGIAEEALRRAVDQYGRNASAFGETCGFAFSPRTWTPRVMTFEELEAQGRVHLGDRYETFAEAALQEAPEGSDERLRAAALVEALVERCSLRGPLVVIGFLPPWYPHRANLGEREEDRAMARAAAEVARLAREAFQVSLEIRPFFEGVSDLSYCGFQGAPEEMDAFARNMPGWGRPYRIPTEALAELDIPVLNLGPLGKDAHKNTERIHLPYYLDVYPRLLEAAVRLAAGEA